MPHVPIYASEDFLGTSERGLYGDVVQEIDWSVGEIIKKLEDYELLENTLIVFSSDNGPWLVMKEHGGSAGILREGKQYTFEGGMRVPTLAMWKSKIEAGTEYNDMACMMDWFPTFIKLAGGNVPHDRPIDGMDISNVLLKGEKRTAQEYLYFNGSELRCYRSGDWKVKKPFAGDEGATWKQPVPAHDTLLINLKADPGERNNVAFDKREKTKTMFKEMEQMLEDMGELPSSLHIRSEADGSHYDYLIEKYGKDYYKKISKNKKTLE
jgi:arylsulfatase A-like enzyme